MAKIIQLCSLLINQITSFWVPRVISDVHEWFSPALSDVNFQSQIGLE